MSAVENVAKEALFDNQLSKYPQFQFDYNAIRLSEPLITNDLLSISDSLGTSWSGLEYAVKTASSVDDKLERESNRNKDEDVNISNNVKDTIRYTQICKHDDIAGVAKDTIEKLQEKGYFLKNINNYYSRPFPNTGYKGLHLNFISPSGQAFELQVHSNESFQAKQEGHELYEKMRAISTPITEKQALAPRINQIHSAVPNPPDINEIKHFDAKKKDIERFMETTKPVSLYYSDEREQGCVYRIKDNEGNDLISGFEMRQKDGSILVGKHINGDDKAYLFSYTADKVLSNISNVEPELINSIKSNDIDSINNVMKYSNNVWIASYNGNLPDNKINKIAEQIVFDKTSSFKTIVDNIQQEDEFVTSVALKRDNDYLTGILTKEIMNTINTPDKEVIKNDAVKTSDKTFRDMGEDR
ncbi:MAG: hypothetical protein J5525_12775 [Lachnospiraceae bacterium]|nr:hypothetical protein [Lachnospiraceae bacterium]